MKKLFYTITRGTLFCAFLVFTISANLSANPDPEAKDKMVEDWQRAKDYTKEYLDAMPADGVTFKPNPDVRSFADQMLHIAGANFAFASAASGKENPQQGKNLETMQEYKSKDALSKIVLESYDFVINAIKDTNEDKFDDNITLFKWDMSRERAFAKAFEHQTHHRGQATIYLRMKGVTPPAEKLF
ncbi:hypothetical protein BH23BAC1_BH23BAC1_35490 [soil metagenome]